MPYSLKAMELRRCRGFRKDGQPCRNWAMWGHPEQLCYAHAGQPGRRRRLSRLERLSYPSVVHANYPPCRCSAYRWPHRPGGGACPWPDKPAQPDAGEDNDA